MLPIDAEFLVLSSGSGRDLLAEVSETAEPRPADLARWRRAHPAEVVSAAVRLSQSRRRGKAKFSRAEAMWLEPTGLEQSTAERVAVHKAARFASAPMAVDLCCGIGSDAVSMAAHVPVIAVDLDPGMPRRALWNAGVHGVADRLLAVQGRAERCVIPEGAFVHVDPDRRAGRAARARSVEGYVPGVDFLHRLTMQVPGGLLKLSPASDFEKHFFGSNFELEIISVSGEAKEASVWFGAMVTARRRATVLPVGATVSNREVEVDASLGVSGVLEWVFDPDPAVTRSGLLEGLAGSMGLSRVAPGVTLMTGRERVDSPFFAAYRVMETSAVDEKRLRRYVAEQGIGRLDIKPRGVDVTPEVLRRRLKPEGAGARTLLLVGKRDRGRAALAIWAERL